MTDPANVVQDLQNFITRLVLKDIRCVAVEGHVINQTGIVPTKVTFSLDDTIDYGLDAQGFICKYRSRVLLSNESELIAEVSAQHVLIHALEPGPDVPTHAIETYAQHNGIFITYPYIRETIQNTVARLGMGNLVLDILQRDKALPTESLVKTDQVDRSEG
jgi:preprotein translocase subunit SecB